MPASSSPITSATPIAHLPAAGELVMADQHPADHRRLCGQRRRRSRQAWGVAPPSSAGSAAMSSAASSPTCCASSSVDVSALQVTPGRGHQPDAHRQRGRAGSPLHPHLRGQWRSFAPPTSRVERCTAAACSTSGGYLAHAETARRRSWPPSSPPRAEPGCKPCSTWSTPGPGDYLPRLEALLPHVDVFLPNNHEAELITGERDPVRQAEQFHRLGAGTAIITLGGEGAVLVSEAGRLRSGVYPVAFVDGSGGGDAFDAGYIYGLLHGLDAEGCLRVASALGAAASAPSARRPASSQGPSARSSCRRSS